MSMSRKKADHAENGDLTAASPLLGTGRASSHSGITRKLKAAAKLGAQSVVGGITALQNAANAAAAPDDINPSDMSWQWFKDLPADIQTLTILNASSAELVNAILNLLFLQVAWGILANLWNRQKNTAAEKFVVAGELLLALDSAVTLAFIAEDSFTFLPYHTNAIPASISFATNFASRLTGIDDAIMRGRNFFNKDAKLQTQLLQALTYIDDQDKLKETFKKVHDDFLLANQDTSDLNYPELLRQFLDTLAVTTSKDDFRLRTAKDKAKAGAGISFDILMAAYIGVCAYITFMQKGYQGKADIVKLFEDDASFTHMAQALMGVFSGVTSGALYFTRALDFRTMLLDLAEHIIDNRTSPILYLKVATLAAANYFASSSGFNMAEKIVEMTSPNTAIVPMVPGSTIAKLYEYGNQAGVLEVNALSTVNKAILNPPTKPDDTLTFKAFLRKLRNPTSILINDESREKAEQIIGAYNARQNQPQSTFNAPSRKASSVASSQSQGMFKQYDPEQGPLNGPRPTKAASNTGVDSTVISSKPNKPPKPRRKFSQ